MAREFHSLQDSSRVVGCGRTGEADREDDNRALAVRKLACHRFIKHKAVSCHDSDSWKQI